MPQRPSSRAKALSVARPRASAVALLASSTILMIAALGFASAARAQPGKPAPATPTSTPGKQTVSKPLWRELTARQQHALEPLASSWDGLTEPHKRKWLAISLDYPKLSAAEQEILQKRMTEWAGLSNQERAQARFNFADVKQVPATERKAKWEAYQALSDEEKKELATRAKTAPNPGAASTIRPVPAQKLVPVPASALEGRMPRIQLAPPPSAPVPATKPPVTPPAISSAPVSAEAQVPAPSPPNAPVDPAPLAPSGVPPRTTDQPSSAP